jgi:hypothetical protein
MRVVFIVILIAAVGVIMFHLGMKNQKHLDKTIVLTTKGIKPSEGDLMRVQHVANDSVYLCIID